MLSYVKENEIAGTSLQGYVLTTKSDLVKAFGSPIEYENDGWDKVTVEWGVRFEDGTIATIYDWKRYELGTPEDSELMEYNIGGLSARAVELVKETLKKKECECENLDEDVAGYTCYKCYERNA